MKVCPPKRTFTNGGSAAYNEAMKNYFGSYPEDMMRNLDNQLGSLAFWSSSASVVLATVASMSNQAAYVLWWVPGWGQVLTTTALVTSVLAVGTGSIGVTFSFLQGTTGFTGVGLDGRKLTPAEATRRQNNALQNGYMSIVGMFTGYMNLGTAGDINDKINGNQSSGNTGSGTGISYDSFNAFKKDNPVKTQGNQWHHIVEQNQVNKSGFSVQQINNTNNLIELTPSQHSQLSGFYSSKPDFTGGLTVRDWLAGQSFETQYKFGIDKLKEFGFMK